MKNFKQLNTIEIKSSIAVAKYINTRKTNVDLKA